MVVQDTVKAAVYAQTVHFTTQMLQQVADVSQLLTAALRLLCVQVVIATTIPVSQQVQDVDQHQED